MIKIDKYSKIKYINILTLFSSPFIFYVKFYTYSRYFHRSITLN